MQGHRSACPPSCPSKLAERSRKAWRRRIGGPFLCIDAVKATCVTKQCDSSRGAFLSCRSAAADSPTEIGTPVRRLDTGGWSVHHRPRMDTLARMFHTPLARMPAYRRQSIDPVVLAGTSGLLAKPPPRKLRKETWQVPGISVGQTSFRGRTQSHCLSSEGRFCRKPAYCTILESTGVESRRMTVTTTETVKYAG
jgi:hypothetical protein